MKWPDTRGWGLIGLFILTGVIILLLAFHPTLSNNTLFVGLATLVVGSGGLLQALSFYYGTSQSSAKKDETLSSIVSASLPQQPKDGQK